MKHATDTTTATDTSGAATTVQITKPNDEITWESVQSDIDEAAFVEAVQESLRNEYATLADL